MSCAAVSHSTVDEDDSVEAAAEGLDEAHGVADGILQVDEVVAVPRQQLMNASIVGKRGTGFVNVPSSKVRAASVSSSSSSDASMRWDFTGQYLI